MAAKGSPEASAKYICDKAPILSAQRLKQIVDVVLFRTKAKEIIEEPSRSYYNINLTLLAQQHSDVFNSILQIVESHINELNKPL